MPDLNNLQNELDKNIDKGASWFTKMWTSKTFRYGVVAVLVVLVVKFLFF